MPVDCRNHRFSASENGESNLAASVSMFVNAHFSTLLDGPVKSGTPGGQIGSGAESLACALHHDHTDRIILICGHKDLDQLLSHGLREGVHFIRSRKRDGCNTFFNLIPRLSQFHEYSSLSEIRLRRISVGGGVNPRPLRAHVRLRQGYGATSKVRPYIWMRGATNIPIMSVYEAVTPAKAGVQKVFDLIISLDSGFRRNDGRSHFLIFCALIKIAKDPFDMDQAIRKNVSSNSSFPWYFFIWIPMALSMCSKRSGSASIPA
jgi:hypothetical protein